MAENLNDQLRIVAHERQAVLDGDIIGFDGNRHCIGVLKVSGAPHTAEQLGEDPKPIALRHLREAKKREAEFTVLDTEGEKPAASTRKKKVATKAAPVEVPGRKTVVDDAANVAATDNVIPQEGA